ncbi:CbiX protein [Sporobacter termitidis DSM 10068]|uniref:CbiX protein n=1 Tax=Sporobacter termitidis DSM 10068 TaxID=1123282 RepID=A0A1M5XKT0_9FIRM|nr:CbiX/SirB N-terminal domain-containing protein [Sporobacter termitidis]SHH99853.1 CbiX protein [Sporobacter termitidis DSM 10068]
MTGILLLAHGSREGDTEETMRRITAYVRAELQNEMVEEAYLQFREKNLEKGLARLVERGADDIRVIPYFLFEGVHIKEDIPAEIEAFNALHPQIKITMGSTLGADRRLAAIVADRVRQIS